MNDDLNFEENYDPDTQAEEAKLNDPDVFVLFDTAGEIEGIFASEEEAWAAARYMIDLNGLTEAHLKYWKVKQYEVKG